MPTPQLGQDQRCKPLLVRQRLCTPEADCSFRPTYRIRILLPFRIFRFPDPPGLAHAFAEVAIATTCLAISIMILSPRRADLSWTVSLASGMKRPTGGVGSRGTLVWSRDTYCRAMGPPVHPPSPIRLSAKVMLKGNGQLFGLEVRLGQAPIGSVADYPTGVAVNRLPCPNIPDWPAACRSPSVPLEGAR